MKKIKEINIKLSENDHLSDFAEEDKRIIEAAMLACENAYAPYSKFRVGCAVLLSDGTVVTGNNQENIAYPSGLCAERVALFHAHSLYPGKPVKKMAIAAKFNGDFTRQPVFPCGACRQVMLETRMRFNEPFPIIMYGREKSITAYSINDLMPLTFDKFDM